MTLESSEQKDERQPLSLSSPEHTSTPKPRNKRRPWRRPPTKRRMHDNAESPAPTNATELSVSAMTSQDVTANGNKREKSLRALAEEKADSKYNDANVGEIGLEDSNTVGQDHSKTVQSRKRNKHKRNRAKTSSTDTEEKICAGSVMDETMEMVDKKEEKTDKQSKQNQKKKKNIRNSLKLPTCSPSPDADSIEPEQQNVATVHHDESSTRNEPAITDGTNTTPEILPTKQKSKNKNKKSRNRKSNGPLNGHTASNNNDSLPGTSSVGKENDDESPGVPPYPKHLTAVECLERYAANDPTLIRGKLRVLPARDAASFVTCDRGLHKLDICIPTIRERNRAMNGDLVYVELLAEGDDSENDKQKKPDDNDDGSDTKAIEEGLDAVQIASSPEPTKIGTWQDDPMQVDLWNPIVPVPRRKRRSSTDIMVHNKALQRKGKVVHIIPPKAVASELDPTQSELPRRCIVGSLKVMRQNLVLLTPNNKSLPQFICPFSTSKLLQKMESEHENTEEPFNLDRILFQAQYQHGSWKESNKWPPCIKLSPLGSTANIEDEIMALLVENNVTTDDFSSQVLKDVDDAVKSGLYLQPGSNEMGWRPTPEMYKDRRDYRSQRIFTIDPTTAKDLDDALHITELADGTIEIGVHIADVSYFIRPGSAVDKEAQERATTVYLVDRTIPMLPRPLCEVACSLNENVERLAFSCVWRMNPDGTMFREKGKDCVWYGRTVIKSCARLDYATAQNIIDGKVAHGEPEAEMDEELWPVSRRPTGGHTVDDVAADVRLMHRVAMARRRLRFDNGALALNGIKLTFQLDSDGQTPLLAAPYPIRDSNRLIEEYMLLANYLVAQRLITHTKGKALLRRHEEPLEEGLDQVAAVAKAGMDFDIDISNSQTLHNSLVRLGNECSDPLVLQCVTQMLMTPMRPAVYFAAGTVESELWRHFALNIPYYTHFTSPIRRYPDVIVHRLLQASLDGERAVKKFYIDEQEIDKQAAHCSEKGLASKAAQERCDRIFLALHVRNHPISSQMGVVLSVGVSTFTVFVPSLGVAAMLFLDEHKEILTHASDEQENGKRRILLQQKRDAPEPRWETLEIAIFTKLKVSLSFRDKPPIDVKVRLEDRWRG